tara:strand:- start:268 stop:2226 length:1959 start_codon:yes stop_codon:yes gene_type:complete
MILGPNSIKQPGFQVDYGQLVKAEQIKGQGMQNLMNKVNAGMEKARTKREKDEKLTAAIKMVDERKSDPMIKKAMGGASTEEFIKLAGGADNILGNLQDMKRADMVTQATVQSINASRTGENVATRGMTEREVGGEHGRGMAEGALTVSERNVGAIEDQVTETKRANQIREQLQDKIFGRGVITSDRSYVQTQQQNDLARTLGLGGLAVNQGDLALRDRANTRSQDRGDAVANANIAQGEEGLSQGRDRIQLSREELAQRGDQFDREFGQRAVISMRDYAEGVRQFDITNKNSTEQYASTLNQVNDHFGITMDHAGALMRQDNDQFGKNMDMVKDQYTRTEAADLRNFKQTVSVNDRDYSQRIYEFESDKIDKRREFDIHLVNVKAQRDLQQRQMALQENVYKDGRSDRDEDKRNVKTLNNAISSMKPGETSQQFAKRLKRSGYNGSFMSAIKAAEDADLTKTNSPFQIRKMDGVDYMQLVQGDQHLGTFPITKTGLEDLRENFAKSNLTDEQKADGEDRFLARLVYAQDEFGQPLSKIPGGAQAEGEAAAPANPMYSQPIADSWSKQPDDILTDDQKLEDWLQTITPAAARQQAHIYAEAQRQAQQNQIRIGGKAPGEQPTEPGRAGKAWNAAVGSGGKAFPWMDMLKTRQ